jgi:hypothetical protein
MPFADEARVVAGLLEIPGKMRLRTVEGVEDGNAVLVAVFAGKNGRATGRTDGVLDETIAEAHSFFGDAIHVGREIDLAPVCTDGVGGVIIRHDENDVRTGFVRSKAQRTRESEGGDNNESSSHIHGVT